MGKMAPVFLLVLGALCQSAWAGDSATGTPLPITWPALLVIGFNLLLFAVWFFVKRLRAPADRGRGSHEHRGGIGTGSHDTTLLPLAVTKAIDIIEQRYTEELGPSELAKEVRVTPRHLGRLFEESTGKTIEEYIDGFRIERAVELLQTTDLPLAEIHQRVGIHRLSRFAKLFKKHTGCPPSEFIREQRD